MVDDCIEKARSNPVRFACLLQINKAVGHSLIPNLVENEEEMGRFCVVVLGLELYEWSNGTFASLASGFLEKTWKYQTKKSAKPRKRHAKLVFVSNLIMKACPDRFPYTRLAITHHTADIMKIPSTEGANCAGVEVIADFFGVLPFKNYTVMLKAFGIFCNGAGYNKDWEVVAEHNPEVHMLLQVMYEVEKVYSKVFAENSHHKWAWAKHGAIREAEAADICHTVYGVDPVLWYLMETRTIDFYREK
jgi:hypothetical protein